MQNENSSNAYWKVMKYYLMNAKIFDFTINLYEICVNVHRRKFVPNISIKQYFKKESEFYSYQHAYHK